MGHARIARGEVASAAKFFAEGSDERLEGFTCGYA